MNLLISKIAQNVTVKRLNESSKDIRKLILNLCEHSFNFLAYISIFLKKNVHRIYESISYVVVCAFGF